MILKRQPILSGSIASFAFHNSVIKPPVLPASGAIMTFAMNAGAVTPITNISLCPATGLFLY
jgi:hypothetical protein